MKKKISCIYIINVPSLILGKKSSEKSPIPLVGSECCTLHRILDRQTNHQTTACQSGVVEGTSGPLSWTHGTSLSRHSWWKQCKKIKVRSIVTPPPFNLSKMTHWCYMYIQQLFILRIQIVYWTYLSILH